MKNRKYIKEVRQRMEDEFQMNTRLQEYLVKVGAVKSTPKPSNLGFKIAIPLVGILTCCVGVLTTYGIMKGKVADDLVQQKSHNVEIALEYFTQKGFDEFSKTPGSSYSVSPNSDLHIYTAKKNDEVFFVSQIFTKNDSKETIDLHYINGMDEMRVLSKKDSDVSSIEIINDNDFVLDDVVIDVQVYLNDVFSSSLVVNLINNL